MKIKYVGSIDEVELPGGVTVKRNHTIDVADDVAGKPPAPRLAEAMVELHDAVEAHDHPGAVKLRAEIAGLEMGEGLLAQEGNFQAVSKKDEVKPDS